MESLLMQSQFSHNIKNRVASLKSEISELIGRPVLITIHLEGINEAAIQGAICDELQLEWEQITSKSRKRKIVYGRQFYCYFNRSFTSRILKDIAADINYYDHTDVIHAVNTAKDLLDTKYEPFTTHFNNIRKVLLNEVEA